MERGRPCLSDVVPSDAQVNDLAAGRPDSGRQHVPVRVADLPWPQVLHAGLHQLVPRRQHSHARPPVHLPACSITLH